MQTNPKHRNNDLLTQDSNDELLIYDLITNKSYCLNGTLASIWGFCDGKNSIAEISEKMSGKYQTNVSEDLIRLALNELKGDNLLENGDEIENKFENLSRRSVIKKIGFASMIALPVLSSIVAPTAAHAQSLRKNCVRNPRPGNSFCYDSDCQIGTCSGFACASPANLAPNPNPFCCSGTRYGIQ